VAADTLTSLTAVRGIVLWQAFIGGALLHVATHPLPNTDLARPAPAWFEGAGALLGIALLGALLVGGRFAAAHAQADVGAALWRLALESAPAVLLAYVVVGPLRGSLPKSSLAWLGRGRPLIQTGKGMVVGLPLPICSCGVVPIYESLIRAGARLLLP